MISVIVCGKDYKLHSAFLFTFFFPVLSNNLPFHFLLNFKVYVTFSQSDMFIFVAKYSSHF